MTSINRLIANVVMGYRTQLVKNNPDYWVAFDENNERLRFSWRPGVIAEAWDSDEKALDWFEPSTNFAHAWSVMTRITNLGWIPTINPRSRYIMIEMWHPTHNIRIQVTEDNIMTAICNAALETFGIPKQGNNDI